MNNKQFVVDALRTESSIIQHEVDPRIIHAMMGLQTETAEITDALKKHMFYGKELDVTNLKEEGGDVLWYLAILFDAVGTDFETEMKRVIAKLKVRFPDKFTNELAENRNLTAERAVLERSHEWGTNQAGMQTTKLT